MVDSMTSVSVIGIYVDDIDKAKEFYCDKLGFEIESTYDDGCILMLKNEGPTLILEQVENHSPKREHGYSQIVVCIATNDIEAKSKDLKKKGIKFHFDEPRPFAAGRFMLMNDPAGNMVELLEFARES
jgi:predicted enzyme related to lactoylglutathione lyase